MAGYGWPMAWWHRITAPPGCKNCRVNWVVFWFSKSALIGRLIQKCIRVCVIFLTLTQWLESRDKSVCFSLEGLSRWCSDHRTAANRWRFENFAVFRNWTLCSHIFLNKCLWFFWTYSLAILRWQVVVTWRHLVHAKWHTNSLLFSCMGTGESYHLMRIFQTKSPNYTTGGWSFMFVCRV